MRGDYLLEGMMKMAKKITLKELRYSWIKGIPRNTPLCATDDEYAQYTAELIILGLLSLNQMKELLVKEDYWKVHRAYKMALKNRY